MASGVFTYQLLDDPIASTMRSALGKPDTEKEIFFRTPTARLLDYLFRPADGFDLDDTSNTRLMFGTAKRDDATDKVSKKDLAKAIGKTALAYVVIIPETVIKTIVAAASVLPMLLTYAYAGITKLFAKCINKAKAHADNAMQAAHKVRYFTYETVRQGPMQIAAPFVKVYNNRQQQRVVLNTSSGQQQKEGVVLNSSDFKDLAVELVDAENGSARFEVADDLLDTSYCAIRDTSIPGLIVVDEEDEPRNGNVVLIHSSDKVELEQQIQAYRATKTS